MHSSIYIREFRESDYAEMIYLWESIGLGGVQRGDDLQIINNTLKMGGQLLLMVERDSGKIVGTSWLTVDGRRTYLHHFGIKSDYQANGLAKILLETSLKLAKTFGMQIKLEVHRDNMRAINLYSKAGFTYLGDYNTYIIRDISTI